MNITPNYNPDLCIAVNFRGEHKVRYIPIIAWWIELDLHLNNKSIKPLVPDVFQGYEKMTDHVPVIVDRLSGSWSNGKASGSDTAVLNHYLLNRAGDQP